MTATSHQLSSINQETNIESSADNTKLTERGLERRLKRHLLKETQSFIAITAPGFEQILHKELENINEVTDIKNVHGGVEFSGPLDLIYDTNLRLRTAHKVLLRIDYFTARSYPELYNKAKRIPWELYIGFSNEIRIASSSRRSRLHHTNNINKAIYDACFSHMRSLGRNVRLNNKSQLTFMVRVYDDDVTISIDSSGELLYKRGYRQFTSRAPIRETSAAAALIESEFQKFDTIVDPFCGSGTMLLEAASMLLKRDPGNDRSFAFESWSAFTKGKWEGLRKASKEGMLTEIECKLFGSDIDNKPLKAAIHNAEQGGFSKFISLNTTDFFELHGSDFPGNQRLLISNLPYGKKIAIDKGMDEFYQKLGIHLKKEFKGWNYAFITSDPNFLDKSKLKGKQLLSFENGGIPVFLVGGLVN